MVETDLANAAEDQSAFDEDGNAPAVLREDRYLQKHGRVRDTYLEWMRQGPRDFTPVTPAPPEPSGSESPAGTPLEVSILNEADGLPFAKFDLDAEVADELRRQAQEQGVTTRALLWRYLEEGVEQKRREAAAKQAEPSAVEPAPATRTLTLELSPAAWAAMEFAALDCGHESIQEGARNALRIYALSTLENYAQCGPHGKDNGESLFSHPAEDDDEEEDETAAAAAANRDDLPLAAAAKPPVQQEGGAR